MTDFAPVNQSMLEHAARVVRLWAGAACPLGYGSMHFGAKNEKAHRLSWMLYRGAIPKGMCVCHRCDTPACVNPDHLFLGSLRDNMRDMMAKGRKARVVGVANPRAKLTPAQVRAIRADPASDAELAARFGVADSTIWMARHGKNWGEL